MSIKWLSNHWFLLSFVFATGGAVAYQETQRQTLEGIVIEQDKLHHKQSKSNEAIIRVEEKMRWAEERQNEMAGKIDKLIDLQLEQIQSLRAITTND